MIFFSWPMLICRMVGAPCGSTTSTIPLITFLVTLSGFLSITRTHDQVEALSMGDRIVVMSQGLVQQVGTPKKLYNSPINRLCCGFHRQPVNEFSPSSH